MARISVPKVAEQLGWAYVEEAPAGFTESWADVPGMRTSATVKHVMRGGVGRWQVTAFVSTFILYTGQVNVPISRTIYAANTPRWPVTDLAPRTWLERLLLPVRSRLSNGGLVLEDPRFNVAYRVRAEDEDFAITLLSPEIQAFMLTKPGLRWYIAHGRLCMIYPGSMRADRIAASVDRLRLLLSLIPEEMEEWEGAAGVTG